MNHIEFLIAGAIVAGMSLLSLEEAEVVKNKFEALVPKIEAVAAAKVNIARELGYDVPGLESVPTRSELEAQYMAEFTAQAAAIENAPLPTQAEVEAAVGAQQAARVAQIENSLQL